MLSQLVEGKAYSIQVNTVDMNDAIFLFEVHHHLKQDDATVKAMAFKTTKIHTTALVLLAQSVKLTNSLQGSIKFALCICSLLKYL